MAIQPQGNGGTVVEVETGTRAMRAVLRPDDVGALGSFSLAPKSGIMAAGLSANSPILAFLWKPAVVAASVCKIRRISFAAWNLGTGFTAGNFVFDFFMARAFTVQDTGGGAVTLTTNNGKTRTSMATTQAAIQASATATLTAGTRTKDANAFRTLGGVVANAAFAAFQSYAEVYRAAPGEQPLILAGTGEGFVIEATVPATGTWTWSCAIDYDELSSYGPLTLA